MVVQTISIGMDGHGRVGAHMVSQYHYDDETS